MEQFIDRGGYALLESKGDGETPEEKQMNNWKKHGIFVELAEKTKISRPTLYKIASWFPTHESPNVPKGIWIKEEDFSQLDMASSELEGAERLLRHVQERFSDSMILDVMEFRMRRELLGESVESFQESLRKQLEAGDIKKGTIERNFDDALGRLQQAIIKLQQVIFGVRHKVK